ncbi:Uncharacterised protein [Clostridioides difficile]|nr:Uncharacterised protein [Clostridioides difficile]
MSNISSTNLILSEFMSPFSIATLILADTLSCANLSFIFCSTSSVFTLDVSISPSVISKSFVTFTLFFPNNLSASACKLLKLGFSCCSSNNKSAVNFMTSSELVIFPFLSFFIRLFTKFLTSSGMFWSLVKSITVCMSTSSFPVICKPSRAAFNASYCCCTATAKLSPDSNCCLVLLNFLRKTSVESLVFKNSLSKVVNKLIQSLDCVPVLSAIVLAKFCIFLL